MFENEVLKRIPSPVLIGIGHYSEDENLKRWMVEYNIQYYATVNFKRFNYFIDAANLKVIDIVSVRTFNENDVNIFCQLKQVHSLFIGVQGGAE